MGKMEQGSLCPRCGDGKVRRIVRRSWMRRFPKSKHFRCKACRAQFLTIFGWAIRLPEKPVTDNA
jgi:hypothetical protein